MEERKFIKLKKEEFGIKEYIKRDLGKGKISKLDIEYTPIGEKIIVHTSRPGLVIGKRGEKIDELTQVLKKRFKLENPHIEIKEIENPLLDAQLVADEIAMSLERMGNLKFKVIAYRKLQEIMDTGALGCELRLTGKLPSERARSWRFAEGYLKKAGESRKEIDYAQSTAITKTGIIGIKVSIMPPNAKLYDRIDIEEARSKVGIVEEMEDIESEKKKRISKVKKVGKKETDEKDDSTTPQYNDKDKKSNLIKDKGSKKSKSSADLENKNIKNEGGSFSEEELETKNENIKPKEDGTAIAIEQEIEKGIPEGIDKELKELEEKHEENVEEGKIDKVGEVSEGEKK